MHRVSTSAHSTGVDFNRIDLIDCKRPTFNQKLKAYCRGNLGVSLTNNVARVVLGMILRGDKQHDIAAWFGENQARIVEVEKRSHGSLAAAPAGQLLPRGAPGLKGRRLRSYVRKAMDLLKDGKADETLMQLNRELEEYCKNEY